MSQFEAQVHQAASESVKRRLEIIGKRLLKEQRLAELIIKKRPGLLQRKAYKLIQSCLHPDWCTDQAQKARYAEAFRTFTDLEKLLLKESESPTKFMNIPKTHEEWEELKRKTAAEQAAKRAASKASKSVTVETA